MQVGGDPKIHTLSTYAPSIFVLLMVVAFLLDVFFTVTITDQFSLTSAGLLLILLGSSLSFWANMSHKAMYLHSQTTGSVLPMGPYTFMRHPGYASLFLLGLGIACVINSLVLLIATLVYYVITQFIVQVEESLLLNNYPDTYTAYQRNVGRYF